MAAGYTVTDACKALGVSRSAYYASRQPRPAHKEPEPSEERLVERIKDIKGKHPFWGYRRVTAWLKHRENMPVGKKLVHRLMKQHDLLARQSVHKAKRTPQRSKPRADKPNLYWGIDMTKFMIPVLGWVYLVIVLDWYTKKIVGWDISLRSRSKEWKQAIEMAINRQFPQGVRDQCLKLISDNGTQPTSTAFMKDMTTLGIEQIFTSYDNPKGNADTERMMRTIKEEIIWLNEFHSLEEAKEQIGEWIEVQYNKLYVHSVLGYTSPEEFERSYNSRLALKEAA